MLLPAVQLAVKSFHVVWRPLGWNMLARALTTPVGVWLVLVLAPQQIALVLGVVILLTVVLSVWSIDIRPTVPNSLVAGALSGISSPSAVAGGPFTALLFQHDSAQRMRSTWPSPSFSAAACRPSASRRRVSSPLSMSAPLSWAPFMLIGYAASARVRRRLAVAGMRRAILAFCVAAGVILAKAVVT